MEHNNDRLIGICRQNLSCRWTSHSLLGNFRWNDEASFTSSSSTSQLPSTLKQTVKELKAYVIDKTDLQLAYEIYVGMSGISTIPRYVYSWLILQPEMSLQWIVQFNMFLCFFHALHKLCFIKIINERVMNEKSDENENLGNIGRRTSNALAWKFAHIQYICAPHMGNLVLRAYARQWSNWWQLLQWPDI